MQHADDKAGRLAFPHPHLDPNPNPNPNPNLNPNPKPDQGEATLPQLVGLAPAEIRKGIRDAAAGDRGGLLRAAPLEGAVGKLESLIRKLHALRREEAD